jgi:hypothetical protein
MGDMGAEQTSTWQIVYDRSPPDAAIYDLDIKWRRSTHSGQPPPEFAVPTMN